MVTRRCFIGTVGGALLAVPLVAEAQPAAKVYRIGFLAVSPLTSPGASRIWEAFLQGLRELGYVEGQNLLFERRYSEGHDERLPELAADLVRLKVDVIVAGATQPAHAAQRATSSIPIVAPNHSDPVGSGLVASLARPGGNITGLSILNPELVGKQAQLLKEVVPSLVRMAVLSNPAHQAHAAMLSQAETAARTLGLQLQRVRARGTDDYEPAFSAMTRNRAQGLLVLGDVTVWFHRAQVADLAIKNRLPTVFAQREHIEAGGLMSYGASLPDNFRRAAVYIDKILKGARPADLPVEQPTTFELVVNLKTAKALGLTIPPSVLARADEFIQ